MAGKVAERLLARLAAVPKGEQGVVAGLAGISPTHYSKWLNGKLPFNPTLETLEMLAVALDRPLGELLAGSEAGKFARGGPTARDLAEAQRLLTEALGLVRGERAAPIPRPEPGQTREKRELEGLQSARAAKRSRKGKTRQRGGSKGVNQPPLYLVREGFKVVLLRRQHVVCAEVAGERRSVTGATVRQMEDDRGELTVHVVHLTGERNPKLRHGAAHPKHLGGLAAATMPPPVGRGPAGTLRVSDSPDSRRKRGGNARCRARRPVYPMLVSTGASVWRFDLGG